MLEIQKFTFLITCPGRLFGRGFMGINNLNLENMKTLIRANKDLYNHGKCFTEGKTYEVNGNVKCEAGLMEKIIINDMGEVHIIGSFWRDFSILHTSQIKVQSYINDYVPSDLRTKFLYWLKCWDYSATYDSFYDKDVLDNCLKYANE